MSFLGDILFGKKQSKTKQDEQFTGTETSDTTGRQKSRQRETGVTNARQAEDTRALSKPAENALTRMLLESSKLSGKPGPRIEAGMARTDDLVNQLIQEADSSTLDVDAIMAAAEAQSQNQLQAETTRLAEAGGSSLNTLVSSLALRSGGEQAINLGALRADLESQARQQRLSGITAGIEASGAATQQRSDINLTTKSLPISLATQLGSVLKGARTTSRGQTRQESDVIQSILATLSQRGEVTKTGETSADAKTKNQDQPGLFDFLGF